jgi:hypothetical protein
MDAYGLYKQGDSLGGTHASPRLHLRRGHIRHCYTGQYVWVRPTTVGNKRLGIIFKDYDASGLSARSH